MTGNTEKRAWAALEFEVPADQEDMACWLLIKMGSKGCDVKPASPGNVLVHASFEEPSIADDKLMSIKQALDEYGLAGCLKSLKLRTVEEEDWLELWKEGFEPFHVGNIFLISPPWHVEDLKDSDLAGRNLVVIEPGMAFGTGLHPTTRYCLEAFERFYEGGDIADVGTGSGILAISAALTNPQGSITAVDVDAQALKTARENIELNRVKERIKLVQGSTDELANLGYDLIFSNLTAEDIVALIIDYLRILRPGGRIICAGILKEKQSLVESAIETYPLKVIESRPGDEWVGLTMERIPVSFGRAG